MSLNKELPIPYADIGIELLECIFNALKYIYDNKSESSVFDTDSADWFVKWEGIYAPFMNNRQKDKHLYGHNKKLTEFSAVRRLAKITIENYNRVQLDSKHNQGICIPYPLSILYQTVTVPDEPQSSAYALVLCRSLLYQTFKVFPDHKLKPQDYESFSIKEISEHLRTLRSHAAKNDNIEYTKSVPVKNMLVHFLASKDFYYLTFRNNKNTDNDNVVKTYFETKDIHGDTFEFHRYSYFEDFPEAAAIMNELAGIPVPVRGADVIFQGGIKRGSGSNLVVRISGNPGSGKTSFALALAAVLSPFGTTTCYLTLEEDPKDLEERMQSLIPGYLKKLSIYRDDINKWFLPKKIEYSKVDMLKSFEDTYIDRLRNILSGMEATSGKLQPAVCPLIVVIDSIRPFLSYENKVDLSYEFWEFIKKCKELNALVILISPSEEKLHGEIDYMVDMVIHLKHDSVENFKEKPVRIMHLLKSRLQISRPGSHVFSLSGETGLRISPQIPSQIDKKHILKKPVPDNSLYNRFFDHPGLKDASREDDKLWLYFKSQILIHGYGSSGKAGLSLSILLHPLSFNRKDDRKDDMPKPPVRKVLIVSLLYSERYYEDLIEKILKNNSEYIQNGIKPKSECIYFYPGYLAPEVFISKILYKLDEAILQGEPFNGILLDGLHNVSLQFNKLQESDMVWPALYSLLAKYSLTVVTTFTSFIVGSGNIDNLPESSDDAPRNNMANYEDEEIMLKGHKPLLHAMTHSADYHFTVSPIRKNKKINYMVNLKAAIKFPMRKVQFSWDREKCTLKPCDEE